MSQTVSSKPKAVSGQRQWYGQGWAVLAWLAVFGLAMSLMGNYDSVLHTTDVRGDSATFLAAGRAWAAGLRPYVDFADSKGPLLWLIYRLGYMMDPVGYTGVFWFYYVVEVAATWWCYRLARLLLPDLGSCRRAAAVCVAMAMWLPYLAFMHREMRPEDLAQLPLAYGLYRLVLAVLRLKWNMGLLLCLLPLGVAVAVAPMALWLRSLGVLDACWREYVAVTLGTVTTEGDLGLSRIAYWVVTSLLSGPVAYLASAWVSVPLLGPLAVKRWTRWTAAAIGTVMWTALTYHTQGYYHSLLAGMMVFPACWLFAKIAAQWRRPRRLLACTTAAVAYLMGFYVVSNHNNRVILDRDYDAEEVSAILCRAADSLGRPPRIIYFRMLDTGLGTRAGTVPACKYWFAQQGSTTEMDWDPIWAINAGRPDFVVARWSGTLPYLTSEGYRVVQTNNFRCKDASLGYLYLLERVPGWPTHTYQTSGDVPALKKCP